MSIFVLGTLAIAFVIPQAQINLTQSLLVAYFDMFKWAHIGWLAPVMAVALAIGVLAGVVNWVAGPSTGLLSVAKAGYLPRFWQKTNAKGMATHILLIQAILVTALSIMFVVLPSVQAAYQILSQLTVILYLVMYLLMFAAGIYLRYSQPNRPRPYHIPGGDAGMWIIGGLGFLGSLLAFVLSFIPPSQISVGSPLLYVAILIGLTVFFVVIPFVVYAIRKPHWRDPENDFAPFTWEIEGGHPGIPTPSTTATGKLRARGREGRRGEDGLRPRFAGALPALQQSAPHSRPELSRDTMALSAQTIKAAVDDAHASCASIKGGANASYIPYLASVPSNLFAVCAVTPDGQMFEAGDARYGFAIESISKVFTLALALEQSGREAVRAKIGRGRPGCRSIR